jgi:hypothetical protein
VLKVHLHATHEKALDSVGPDDLEAHAAAPEAELLVADRIVVSQDMEVGLGGPGQRQRQS